LKILAIDTSTDYCSAALLHGKALVSRSERAGQRHSELVLPMIDALLAEAGIRLGELDGVAFGAGPGSFTGLRIACGVAQGLALGADVPVVPVGTLLALAQAGTAARVVACLDARMGEIYHAAYERRGNGWHEAIAPTVCRAELAPALEEGDWHGAGSGFATYGRELALRYGGQLAAVDPEAYPHASSIAELAVPQLSAGRGLPAGQAVPFYIRDRVALKMNEQR
jgi:tRNA threonylcarbamoyladenosine biosynthesis protein TsaB